MEFKLATDLQKELPAEIDFNFLEIRDKLQERLEHYKNLAVTEDTIKEGKEDRARLNKLRTAIDTRRKEIKKQYMVPFNNFEAKTKELIALVDEPISAIDDQLKVFESKRKEEKMTEIEDLYESMVEPELDGIIPLKSILNPSWLNATTSIKKVSEELDAIVKRTKADLMLLDTVEPNYAAAVRDTYLRTRDIEAAMKHRETMMRSEELFRKQQEAKQRYDMEVAAKEAQEPQPEPMVEPEPVEETVYLLRLEMQVTRQQAKELKAFLVNRNIQHTKI